MKILISCYARFSDIFGDETTIETSEPATILDVIRTLAKQEGPDSELLINTDGKIREDVMIMYHDMRVFPRDAGNFLLKEGDAIILFDPVSGG